MLSPGALLEASLRSRAEAAAREAECVYFVRVPEAVDKLPAAVAVKPTPPPLDCGGETLLRSMVPDGAAAAASRYSEMVDALAREQAAILEAASDAARTRLRELDLPEVLDATEPGNAAGGGAARLLPPPLLASLSDFGRAGGGASLASRLGRLRDLSAACRAALASVAATLSACEAASSGGGGSPHGPPHAAAAGGGGGSGAEPLLSGVREKLRGYESGLAAASRSDEALANRIAAAAPALEALDAGSACAGAPVLRPRRAADAAPAAAAVSSLRDTVRALEANAAQRAAIEETLRDAKAGDDVLAKIMASPGDGSGYEAVFASEIKKYDDLKAGVAANAAACGALVERLSQQAAKFSSLFDVSAFRSRSSEYAADLRDGLAAAEALGGSLSEGAAFYAQLRAAAAALSDEASGAAAAAAVAADDARVETARRAALEAQSRSDGERAAAMAAAAEAAERDRKAARAEEEARNARAAADAHAAWTAQAAAAVAAAAVQAQANAHAQAQMAVAQAQMARASLAPQLQQQPPLPQQQQQYAAAAAQQQYAAAAAHAQQASVAALMHPHPAPLPPTSYGYAAPPPPPHPAYPPPPSYAQVPQAHQYAQQQPPLYSAYGQPPPLQQPPPSWPPAPSAPPMAAWPQPPQPGQQPYYPQRRTDGQY